MRPGAAQGLRAGPAPEAMERTACVVVSGRSPLSFHASQTHQGPPLSKKRCSVPLPAAVLCELVRARTKPRVNFFLTTLQPATLTPFLLSEGQRTRIGAFCFSHTHLQRGCAHAS